MTRQTDEGGRLVLVGTPIGNRADLSPRARDSILSADLLLCEDTRSPLRLLGPEAKLPPRVSCFEGNEAARCERMLRALESGQVVAFVSEAGLPVWSDPGARLVEAAVASNFPVEVVPGPCAATSALCVSGFDAAGSLFIGFLPRKGSARTQAWEALKGHSGPVVLYESPHRVRDLLRELAENPLTEARQILVARELTKLHEQLLRGTAAELLARWSPEEARGEFTLVLGPASPEASEAEDSELRARQVLELALEHPELKPRARAKAIAELCGLDAREVYERLSAARART